MCMHGKVYVIFMCYIKTITLLITKHSIEGDFLLSTLPVCVHVYTCTCPKVEYRNTGISATVMAKACMMDTPSVCLIDILAPPLPMSLHIQSLAP